VSNSTLVAVADAPLAPATWSALAAAVAPATLDAPAIGHGARAAVAAVVDSRADAVALRQRVAIALGDAAVDLAVRGPTARPARLVVMDMDSTAIAIEVIDELARVHGVGPAVAAITEQAMRGELDFEASLRARVAQLAGLPVAELDALAARLPLSPGMSTLVEGCRARGVRLAIASGGFTFAAEALGARLGLDHVEANRLARADGRLTGEVVGPVVTAARKAAIVDELAARFGLDLAEVVAIGDGANDRAMLARAGLGVAYRAKPALRAAADATIDHGGLDHALAFLA
jgi:phosphoserine phosphatase